MFRIPKIRTYMLPFKEGHSLSLIPLRELTSHPILILYIIVKFTNLIFFYIESGKELGTVTELSNHNNGKSGLKMNTSQHTTLPNTG
jgi:hypothetical protein